MDSKPELTNLQRSQIDEMVSMAGELLFETGSGNRWTRNVLKELAHCLGRLYGETIRTCRGYDGLKEEVTTTFMCGMALEPNFGREEEKTPGQLLYEKQKKASGSGLAYPPWDELIGDTRSVFEQEAMAWAKAAEREKEAKARALYPEHAKLQEEKAKSPGQMLYEKQVEECGEDCPPWKLLDCVTMENLERDAMENLERDAMNRIAAANDLEESMARAKACWKCHGSGDMGFTTPVACDACQ